jgi:predicted nucleotidyltransferase
MYLGYRLDPEKFRLALAARGYSTTAALLKAAGLHRNSLNEYLAGRKSVFSSVTEKISAALDCDPLSLLSGHEQLVSVDSTGAALQRILERVSAEHPHVAFFLIGSRAKGSHQKFSDWDVAISSGRSALSTDEYLAIKSKIEDGVEDLSVGVDVVNFDGAPPWFIAGITYEPRFLAGDERAFSYVLGVIDGARKATKDIESR